MKLESTTIESPTINESTTFSVGLPELHAKEYPGASIKTESKSEVRKKIHQLQEEIEGIKLAHQKIENAKRYGIPQDAIADDVSLADIPLSIKEQELRDLDTALHSPGKKSWWKKAALIAGFTLGGLLATAKAEGKKEIDVQKSKIEASSEKIT